MSSLVTCLGLLAVASTLVAGQPFQPNARVKELIDQNVAIVNRLADTAIAEFGRRCSGSCLSSSCSQLACMTPLQQPTCTNEYGSIAVTTFRGKCSQRCSNRKLDLQNSVVRYPSSNPSTLSNAEVATETCWTRNMDTRFKQELAGSLESTTLRWQYIGTPNGFYRIYPGSAQESCNSYDPRVRPWYVAATSGPKNVILVIDVSGSMLSFNRLSIAKDAATTVVNTLTNFDYVGLVIFSDDARVVPIRGSNFLIQATNDNLRLITSAIDTLRASGGTNYGAAFNTAFDLLERSRSAESFVNCHSAILFLTDGVPTVGVRGENSLTNLVTNLNQGDKATVFTFALGSGASQTIPKGIACANKGIFIAVPDGGDLRSAMSQYYDYYSTLRQSVDNLSPIWVEPYVDFFGLGDVTTVSRALYDSSTNPPRLYGVVAVDILIRDLRNADPTNWQQTITFLSRQVQCPTLRNVSECQLDAIRVSRGNEASRCGNTNCNEESVSHSCPSHGSIPRFCSTRRSNYQGEVCCQDSPLSPACGSVTTFDAANVGKTTVPGGGMKTVFATVGVTLVFSFLSVLFIV